jgi:hypothetical protein
MTKRLWIGLMCVASGVGAYAAAVGVSAAVAGNRASGPRAIASASQGTSDVTPEQDAVRRMAVGDQIPVVDSKGDVRGTIERTDLYADSGEVRDAAIMVPVHDGSGNVVGYYGNITGFIERSVAEQPGFDLREYALENHTLPKSMGGTQ